MPQTESILKATLSVQFVWPDNRVRPVLISVGPIIKREIGDYSCEVDLVGLDGELDAMLGDDSLSALSMGLLFLRRRIERFIEAGGRVVYDNSDDLILLDLLFPNGAR